MCSPHLTAKANPTALSFLFLLPSRFVHLQVRGAVLSAYLFQSNIAD